MSYHNFHLQEVLMMRIMIALIGASLLITAPRQANSAELKVFASRAVWTVLQKIGPEFEKETSHKLTLITGLSPEFLKRINGGESFDVVAAPPPVLDGLVRSGKVVGSSKVNLVRSDVGVVVRAGAPKPDVSSVEAFKQTLLNAKSITYLPTPGVPALLERLGLKETLASKTTVPKTEISTELVAKGEIELAIIVVTQAFTTPGVELAGPLPPEIQTPAVFGAAISSNSQAPGAAQRLLDSFKTPRAIEVIKAQGMDPM
ncbi:MAG: molybdate ABC transporter substrate-binding protein [Xanthobacteraceae bacterium]